jgi:transposase
MEPANPQCPGCIAAAVKISALQRQVEDLQRQINSLQQTLEQLSRTAKRQAAPFARHVPKADPKKPGRKPGPDYGTHAFRPTPPPETIDETHDAPLPEKCPRCGGTLVQTHIDQQYQVEIPRKPIYRQFTIAVGRCSSCDARVRGRHPLQTSDATGCCQSQVGPQAQAAAVLMNKELGLSQGKISRLFDAFLGIKLSPGGSCQIMQRAAARCQGHCQAIVQRVRESPWIVPDETGWRIGGRLAWLHVAAGDVATAYLIARERGYDAAARLIGPDYAGSLIHDGWRAYERFVAAVHQTCLGHLLGRCRGLLEQATRGAVRFPRQVQALLTESLELRDKRDAGMITLPACIERAGDLYRRLIRLIKPLKTHAANERLAEHLWRNRHCLLTFLEHPGIDATNYRAEQAIRPAVVNRKVWGGNRTHKGAAAQSILMTMIATLRQNRCDALGFLSRQLQATRLLPLPLPPPG